MQLVIIQGDEDRPGLEQHLASHQGGPSLHHQVLTMMKKLQDLVKTVNNRRDASNVFVMCHVNFKRAWLHTIFSPWSLLSKKVKMSQMLLLL